MTATSTARSTPTSSPPVRAGAAALDAFDRFVDRHIGPDTDEVRAMLETIGFGSLDALIDQTIPNDIRLAQPMQLANLPGDGLSEGDALRRLESIALRNEIHRSYIGMGYYNTDTPAVIRRNILESPGWYTQYTPYQAEIAQGRLELLLNFQTMVSELSGLDVANASLLDEATAAAEAMAMCIGVNRRKRMRFCVSDACHPQTLNVLRTRAASMGIDLEVGDLASMTFDENVAGALAQNPTTEGRIVDWSDLAGRVHEAGGMMVIAADLLAMTLFTPPGEMGADIACGTTQRFGCPLGAGGPHAGYLACREKHVRKMPGRIVGVSRDAHDNTAYRLAIQTREQHIKRDRATSNICTAQVLPAVIAAAYGMYHGPEGLLRIGRRVHAMTGALESGLRRLGYEINDGPRFDTITIRVDEDEAHALLSGARQRRMNLRDFGDGRVGVALDETTTRGDLADLLDVFARGRAIEQSIDELADEAAARDDGAMARTREFMQQDVFNQYRSEHEMLRYLHKLQERDLSLTTSMIPLGSCTMKLNAAAEMLPITWPQFSRIHPYAPADQQAGYQQLYDQLIDWLKSITGFDAVSLQPNAGSQGEYAGLLAIRGYHAARGEGHRNVCLIPTSAHGTNPASAVVAGMTVVPVGCRENGDIDLDDLRARAAENADHLAAIMITYPSTHGVFERTIVEACGIVHEHGGQVYLDGANMNAQVGLTTPANCGADVCHLNLHKTFCIPHGGGGPGMGPIAVAAHLAEFLPGDPLDPQSGVGAISAAPSGSPSILPISWMYIATMGAEGLRRASEVAILNANYMAKRLRDDYPVLYTGANDTVAHEFILDCRPLAEQAHVTVDDIAKRLMDYGFHAPTMSWPVAGTFMVEPTESENRAELDRLCDAMIAIRREADDILHGRADAEDNPLSNSPHTQHHVTSDDWPHPYSREQAAYPAAWLRDHKYWPPVARIDNPYGDRHLVCTCPDMSEFGQA